ncbi:MAG: HNH endonuclease [Bullifex sp.]
MTEAQYIEYLRCVYRKKDGGFLTEASIAHYGYEAMRLINQYFSNHMPEFRAASLYEIEDLTLLRIIKDKLLADPDFRRTDSIGHNMYSAGLNRYMEFAEGASFKGKKDVLCKLDIPEPVMRDQYSDTEDQKREKTGKTERDKIKVVHVKEAYDYKCHLDPGHNTFIAEKTRRQYVEGHHIIPLKLQGEFSFNLDCYANIIVLCPICHRFFHYGQKSKRKDKLKMLYDERAERFANAGILIDRPNFLEMVNENLSR